MLSRRNALDNTSGRARDATNQLHAKPLAMTAEQALQNGDGYDWRRLSTREKARVGLLCVERTGRHTAFTYVDFIDTFYTIAEARDVSLLKKPMSELASVAATLEMKD